jgi:hypothetical protein
LLRIRVSSVDHFPDKQAVLIVGTVRNIGTETIYPNLVGEAYKKHGTMLGIKSAEYPEFEPDKPKLAPDGVAEPFVIIIQYEKGILGGMG